MASFSPLDNAKARSRGMVPTGIVIDKLCRVYVTQIPLERIERDGASAMKAEFEVYGPLESYKMFTDRSGRFVGSALCTYRNPADASMAVYCMNGVEVEGSTLHVEPAKEHGVVLLSGTGGGHTALSRQNAHHEDHSRGFLRDTRWQSARGERANAGWLNGDQKAAPLQWSDASTLGPNGTVSDVASPDDGSADPLAASSALKNDDDDDDGGKWSHDKYQMLAEGRDMDEVLGIRRPMRGGARGRGGGGRGVARYGDRVDRAFEQYIRDRDATSAEDGTAPHRQPPPAYPQQPAEEKKTDEDGGDEAEPAKVVGASSNAEAMGEIAFGGDESTAPVAGKELGALPEEEAAKAEE